MPAESSARLAGFALAHAAWSTSDLPAGQSLTPFVIAEHGGERELMRFAASTQDAAIAEGKRATQRLASRGDAWAFARDGLLRAPGSEAAQHVLVVEFGWGDEKPGTVIQPYEPYASNGRFRILGDPMLTRGGEVLGPGEVAPILDLLQEGIRQHPAVTELWVGWRGDAPPGAASSPGSR